MDYRSLFSETERAADRALAKPAEYAAYKKTFNESLKSKDPFFGKMDVQPCLLVYTPEQRAALSQLGLQLHQIVEIVIQMYINGVHKLLDEFPQYILFKPLMERQLISYQEYGRYDFIVDRAGDPVFIETNAAMASGYLPLMTVQEEFAKTAPEFLRVAGMQTEHPKRDEVFGSSIARMVRTFTSDDGAVAVLVDENHKMHEVEMIAASLRRAGLEVVVGDVADLVYDHGYRLGHDGPEIIATFNKFRLFGSQHHWSAAAPARHHTFLEGIRNNAFLSINNFACLTIAEDKAIFAAMRSEAVQAALTPEQKKFIRRHTPDSYPFSPGMMTLEGTQLLADMRVNRGEWILKPRNDYRGGGAYSGRDYDAEGWKSLLDTVAAQETPYLAQRRVDAHMFRIAVAEEAVVRREEVRILGGLYYRHLSASGIVARVSPSEIANVSSGKAYVLPDMEIPGAAG